MWRSRHVQPIDTSQFPLQNLLGAGSVAVRETTTPQKNRLIRNYPFSSLIAITQGRSLYTLSGRPLEVQAPGILIRPAGEDIAHQGDPHEDCSLAYLCLVGPCSEHLAPLRHAARPYAYFARPNKKLRDTLLSAVDAAFQPGWDGPYLLAEKLNQLYRLLGQELPQLRDSKPSLLQQLNLAVQGDWSQPRSAHELAALVGLSRSEFHRQFRLETGETPAAWVRRQRLNLAQFYLKSGYSITEVADILHFSSPFALSRAFYALTGRRPKTIKANKGAAAERK